MRAINIVDAKRASALAQKAHSLLHRCFLAFCPGYVKALTSTNFILRRSTIYYAKRMYAFEPIKLLDIICYPAATTSAYHAIRLATPSQQ